MIGWLFGIQSDGPIRYPELGFRSDAPAWVILLCLLAAIGFAGYAYWREDVLNNRQKIFLGVMRALAYAIIIILLFEPKFSFETEVKVKKSLIVMLDATKSMSIADPRVGSPDAILEAALATDKLPYPSTEMDGGKDVRERISHLKPGDAKTCESIPRSELARGILKHGNLKIFDRFAKEYNVGYFTFGDKLEAFEPAEDETLPGAFVKAEPVAESTHLGGMLDKAVNRFSGRIIAGVVLLTDGASNQGEDPLETARKLGNAEVPVFPVGIGMPTPPDINI
ncbi:MAG: VWA domain-containing protein, partial [Planctomycetes bacterium]|nr:VWA domain-containing protein [Planctomycetota bacterium]